MPDIKKRVLAVASTGGHWEQLMQLAPAFDGFDTTYACTDHRQGELYQLAKFHGLRDYSQTEPMKALRGLGETFLLIAKVRPHVVISTGAAPGLLCLFWGRIFGAKTIWVDSIANSEQLSMSGRLALKFCHTVCTQWEHLASESQRPRYQGSLL
ncbi:UDP-N-acetylglucosamine--LPS N-acetylglucosamine transferase [Phaeovulum sp. W22_SRMD_FR3]|uniref:UDP-N-acetylglucosamine--LPS N-acetylglucosamine transferase n=1 Tax=Phaeovulum sp. W22_SRMD_FR3 TaxID=3240274 RepID=UPI003F9BDEE7